MGRAIMLRHLLRLRPQCMPRQLLLGRAIPGYLGTITQLAHSITGGPGIGRRVRMQERIGSVRDITDIAIIRATGADKSYSASCSGALARALRRMTG